MKNIIVILILFISSASAYQPHDAYELDEYEIQYYIEILKQKPDKNKEEIIKFERILNENIQDYIEYFIKYEDKKEG